MKKTIAALTLLALTAFGVQTASAGHNDCTATKVLTGLVAAQVVANAFAPPPPVYVAAAPVVVQPAPQVVYQQAAQPVYVQAAPVYVQPAPVYIAAPRVWYPPVPVLSFNFAFGHGYHGGHYGGHYGHYHH
jgi:hypothetical protein